MLKQTKGFEKLIAERRKRTLKITTSPVRAGRGPAGAVPRPGPALEPFSPALLLPGDISATPIPNPFTTRHYQLLNLGVQHLTCERSAAIRQ